MHDFVKNIVTRLESASFQSWLNIRVRNQQSAPLLLHSPEMHKAEANSRGTRIYSWGVHGSWGPARSENRIVLKT